MTPAKRHVQGSPFSFRAALLLAAAVVGAGVVPEAAWGQDLHPSRRLSPMGMAKIHLGDTYVKVTYSRPYMRDRDIFGDASEGEYLVPLGELWRTGANEATEITATGPIMVGGERLDAGTYSVFTVPGADSWEIRFSPQLGLDGTGMLSADGEFTPDVYDADMDVATVTALVTRVEEEVDPFTIELVEVPGGADLVISWEHTEVRVPVRSP